MILLDGNLGKSFFSLQWMQDEWQTVGAQYGHFTCATPSGTRLVIVFLVVATATSCLFTFVTFHQAVSANFGMANLRNFQSKWGRLVWHHCRNHSKKVLLVEEDVIVVVVVHWIVVSSWWLARNKWLECSRNALTLLGNCCFCELPCKQSPGKVHSCCHKRIILHTNIVSLCKWQRIKIERVSARVHGRVVASSPVAEKEEAPAYNPARILYNGPWMWTEESIANYLVQRSMPALSSLVPL